MIADGWESEGLWEYREEAAKRQEPRSENHEVVSTLAEWNGAIVRVIGVLGLLRILGVKSVIVSRVRTKLTGIQCPGMDKGS